MRILDTYFPVMETVTVFSALLIGFILADHHILSDIVEVAYFSETDPLVSDQTDHLTGCRAW